MKKLLLVVFSVLFAMPALAALADTFRANGAVITAVKDGDNRKISWKGVTVDAADFYVGHGVKTGYIYTVNVGQKGLELFQVPKNGKRFQLKQGGKWVYISPDGNDGLTLVNVRRVCDDPRGCALEVIE